jgi:hypothetical protein
MHKLTQLIPAPLTGCERRNRYNVAVCISFSFDLTIAYHASQLVASLRCHLLIMCLQGVSCDKADTHQDTYNAEKVSHQELFFQNDI